VSDDEHDGLDPDLELALRSLPREQRPPAPIEEHIVQTLRSEGLLRPASPALRPWLRLAASIALLALGFASGVWWVGDRPGSSEGTPRFLFLLHEPPGPFEPPTPEQQRAVVDEYKAWAAAGRQSGFLLDGVKLKDDGKVLPEPGAGSLSIGIGPSSGEPFIGGYFVVQASGYDEALRLAQGCPHLRHGGTIEIREVDPV